LIALAAASAIAATLHANSADAGANIVDA